MILPILGTPCSGKSTLLKYVLAELDPPEHIEPMKLFLCQKHDDILVIGRYSSTSETFGGTDRLSYGTIPKFASFIDEQIKNYRHIIFEGDRFTSCVEALTEKYECKVFILTVSLEEELRRHKERKDNQTYSWLAGRRTQLANLQNNLYLREHLLVRPNKTMEDSEKIKKEIKKYLTIIAT